MVDVAAPLPANFQQWTFEKNMARPGRSHSAATTPDLDDAHDSLRIEPAATTTSSMDMDANEPFLQRRYLSSEEDLSPLEGEDDDDDLDDDKFSINDDSAAIESIEKATIITAQTAPPKAVGLAISISYVSAGRPKVIDLASPLREREKEKERERKTMSLAPQPSSSMLTDSSSISSGRSSALKIITGVRNNSIAEAIETDIRPRTSTASSFSGEGVPRSSMSTTSSSATEEYLRRPQVARFESLPVNKVRRASMFVAGNSYSPMSPKRPAALASPVLNPSFLSTDPFASDSRNAASPILKQPQHKRLRSISRTLSLAKIAVMPNKKGEAKKDIPQSPQTPMSAPPIPSTMYQSRKLAVKTANEPVPTPEVPMSAGLVDNNRASFRLRPSSKHSSMSSFGHSESLDQSSRSAARASTGRKLVARGADEREPVLQLPPFPLDADMSDLESRTVTKQRLKKRKSLLGFV